MAAAAASPAASAPSPAPAPAAEGAAPAAPSAPPSSAAAAASALRGRPRLRLALLPGGCAAAAASISAFVLRYLRLGAAGSIKPLATMLGRSPPAPGSFAARLSPSLLYPHWHQALLRAAAAGSVWAPAHASCICLPSQWPAHTIHQSPVRQSVSQSVLWQLLHKSRRSRAPARMHAPWRSLGTGPSEVEGDSR